MKLQNYNQGHIYLTEIWSTSDYNLPDIILQACTIKLQTFYEWNLVENKFLSYYNSYFNIVVDHSPAADDGPHSPALGA